MLNGIGTFYQRSARKSFRSWRNTETAMKKKRKENGKGGRHDHSGVLSGIRPERETWTDIRNRIIYDSAEWPLVALRTLIGDGSMLADNFLSADYLSTDTHDLQRQEKALRQKIATFWRPLIAQFERAVLDGDADWFKRQLQALSSKQSQEKIQFNAKVVHLLEHAMWGTHVKQRPMADEKREPNSELIERRKAEQAGMTKKQVVTRTRKPERFAKGAPQDRLQREHAAKFKQTTIPQHDLTLTPAEKFTDAMASDIYNALKEHKKDGVLRVAGCPFTSKERAMQAIRDLAEQLRFELRKQHGK
jgi:hypothetical protein